LKKVLRILCYFNWYCDNGNLRAKPLSAGGKGVWGRISQRSSITEFFLQKEKNNALLDIFSGNSAQKPAKFFRSLLCVLNLNHH